MDNSASHSDCHSLGSIRGTKLLYDAVDVRLYGLRRNKKLVSNISISSFDGMVLI